MNTDRTRLKRLSPLAVISSFAIAIFIEIASIVQSIRQDSWAPMNTTGWLPVVVLAAYRASNTKECWPLLRRRTES